MSPSPPSVALIAMPWRLLSLPDHRTPGLASFLRGSGVAAVDYHLYLDVAEHLGVSRYETVYPRVCRDALIQEAFYAALLAPECRAANVDLLLDAPLTEPVVPLLEDWQAALEAAFAAHDWGVHDWVVVVGSGVMSSPDFHFLAGLYAAKMIRQIHPEARIGLAGSDFTGRVGHSVIRTVPWVDFVIDGEPEAALRDLVLSSGNALNSAVPGLVCRVGGAIVANGRSEQLPDLDALAVPDYGRYFDRPLVANVEEPLIPIEGARGCWWDRSYRDPAESCRFCNINIEFAGYRAKSIERVVSEIREQTERYGVRPIVLTDKITRPRDATALFRAIADAGLGVELRYVEGHASLPAEAFLAMRDAGVTSVQLGIEALAPSLLEKMNKGVSFIKLLVALRNCAECGIGSFSNLILWYPGSTAEEVAETLKRLPLLLGYPPLDGAILSAGEGSPLATIGAPLGVISQENPAAYRAMLPPEMANGLHTMARCIEAPDLPDWQPVLAYLQRWRVTCERGPEACYHRFVDGAEGLAVERKDLEGRTFRMVVTGPARDVFLACREPVRTEKLPERLPGFPLPELAGYAQALIQHGAIAEIDGHLVSLPVKILDPASIRPHVAAEHAPKASAGHKANPQPALDDPLDAVVQTIGGETVSLRRYEGDVLMIVNTASRCRFTAQYEALERIYQAYREQGLRILAFPCNDFAYQEPGSAEQIREFCTWRYGATFDLFDKVHVVGPDQHPLFSLLTSGRANPDVSGPVPWNFTKFILDRHGRLVASFPPDVPPDAPAVSDLLDELLAKS